MRHPDLYSLADCQGGRTIGRDPIRFTRGDVARYFATRFPQMSQRGKEWRIPCPVHHGERDSFSVNSETGLCFCHSKCDRGFDILQLEIETQRVDFVAAKKNIFEIIGRSEERHTESKLGPIVAAYDYTDEGGDALYQITRHFPPKDFRQRYPDGEGGWIWKKHPNQVLYHLPEVLEAPIVFLVEGEKDVETLREYGFVATTHAGGAKAPWLPQFTAALAGREVILIPDNDHDGRQHMLRVARALRGQVARLVMIELEGAKDITEWFEAGHSELALIALVDGAHQGVSH